MGNPLEKIPKAVYIAIPVVVFIYIIVVLTTYNLAPQTVQNHPHTALTTAASIIASVVGLASTGVIILSLSALFSTGMTRRLSVNGLVPIRPVSIRCNSKNSHFAMSWRDNI